MKGMVSFEESIVTLVQHSLVAQGEMAKAAANMPPFRNMDDRVLRLGLPRGAGNTKAALVIIETFDDSFMLVDSERQRRNILSRLAPRPKNLTWAEKSHDLDERIITIGGIDRQDGMFMRGASFAKLKGTVAQIVVTDGISLTPMMLSNLYFKWNVALLVNIGK